MQFICRSNSATPQPASNRRRSGGAKPSLVRFRSPGGGTPHSCAVIWRKGSRVRICVPLVRLRDGIADPGPGMRLFGPRLHAVNELERPVERLHAICFTWMSRCQKS